MLTLYGFGPASNSLKPLLTLYEKALPFEHQVLNGAAFEQHADWFIELNPRGQVPVLVHDDRIVTESSVICEYLEDAFPDRNVRLRPVDPLERAEMRIWMKWVDDYLWLNASILSWSELIPRITAHLTETEFQAVVARVPVAERQRKWNDARAGFSPEVRESAYSCMRSAARMLNDRLEARSWLVGEAYTLADICVFSSASEMDRKFPQFVNDQETPSLGRWLKAMRDRAAVKAMYAGVAAAQSSEDKS